MLFLGNSPGLHGLFGNFVLQGIFSEYNFLSFQLQLPSKSLLISGISDGIRLGITRCVPLEISPCFLPGIPSEIFLGFFSGNSSSENFSSNFFGNFCRIFFGNPSMDYFENSSKYSLWNSSSHSLGQGVKGHPGIALEIPRRIHSKILPKNPSRISTEFLS